MNTNNTHTPGPWAFSFAAGEAAYVTHDDGFVIARVSPEGFSTEANARLIAAAPELLAALKEAREVLAVALAWPGSEGVRSRMTVAIAKAEGAK